MTTDKILDKLSKLKAMQESEAAIGNSNAAEAFASMINAMLLKHELSMIDIPQIGAKEDPIVEVPVNHDVYNIKKTRVRIGWQEVLADVVARAHLCKYLIAAGTNKIWFVGTKSNATVAEYAYGVLASSADRMSMAAREQWWKEECGGVHLKSGNYRAAWLTGFIERIAERFAEARRKEVQATGNSGMALIRLDQALVRAADYIKDNYKKKGPKAAQLGMGSDDGYDAGRAAADRMSLGKGLESNSAHNLPKALGGK